MDVTCMIDVIYSVPEVSHETSQTGLALGQ